MADYYIHAVHQDKEVIVKVKTCTSYTKTGGPGTTTEKNRSTIVSDIDVSKKTIFTIYKNSKDEWILGETVKTEEIDKVKYIKTKANGKKSDNLDNIEQY
jgi:hypothetical protein